MRADPRGITFVPVDFGREPLHAALAAAGHRTDEATHFLCEGVAPYVPTTDVAELFRTLAGRAAPGSTFAVDVVAREASARSRVLSALVRAGTASLGERMVTILIRWHDGPGRARAARATSCRRRGRTLLGYLEYQRATLAWKVRGLDAAGMRTAVGVSTMTLGGLLKHMAEGRPGRGRDGGARRGVRILRGVVRGRRRVRLDELLTEMLTTELVAVRPYSAPASTAA